MSRLLIKTSANQELELRRNPADGTVLVVIHYFGVRHAELTLSPAQANDAGTWLFATEPV